MDASTTLTQSVLASAPLGSLAAEATSSSTHIDVGDHTVFPPSASNGVIGASDSFAYTGKGGKFTSFSFSTFFGIPSSDMITGAGTISFSGGSGTGFAASYDEGFILGFNNVLTISNGGTGYGNAVTGTWTCDQDSSFRGTWESNSSGVITTINYDLRSNTKAVFSTTSLTFTINGNGSSAAFAVSGGASTFKKVPNNITITNAGVGYSTNETQLGLGVQLSTTTTANRGFLVDFTVDESQLTGVTGVGTTHPIGTAVALSGTMDTMHVTSTTDSQTRWASAASCPRTPRPRSRR